MAEQIKTIRVYRDDNSTIDPEYLAVINDQECYIAELLQVALPEWSQAKVRLGKHIRPPHSGLLDGSVAVNEGWHYLLETGGIIEVTWRPDRGHDQYSEYAEEPGDQVEHLIQIRARSIAANVASLNRALGGSHVPVYGGIIPGMEEEQARAVLEVVITLAPGTVQDGDEYMLPGGLRTKVDSLGTFGKAEFAE